MAQRRVVTDEEVSGKTKGYTYHDKGTPEVATTALLMDIEGRLIAALRSLECQPWELFPILLGTELRRNGKSCLANYTELQQYQTIRGPVSRNGRFLVYARETAYTNLK